MILFFPALLGYYRLCFSLQLAPSLKPSTFCKIPSVNLVIQCVKLVGVDCKQTGFRVYIAKKWLKIITLFMVASSASVMSLQVHAASPFLKLEQQLSDSSPSDALTLLNEFQLEPISTTAYNRAKLHFLYGKQYARNRLLEQSIASYDMAIVLAKPLMGSELLIESYLGRSFARYLQTNDPEVYCSDRAKALVLARRQSNRELLAKSLTQNAFCFNKVTNVHHGIALLDEAMLLIDTEDKANYNRKAMIFNATGSLYRTVGLHKRGYVNFEKAYQNWSEIDDTQDMFNMLHNMISEAVKLGDWEKARDNIEQQFLLAVKASEFNDFGFFAHLNAGRVELATHNYVDAIEHLEQAISLKDTTREQYFITSSYLFLAQAYLRSGDVEQAAAMARIFKQDSTFPKNMSSMTLKADAIIALEQQQYLSAINALLEVIDKERQKNKQIIDNEVIDLALEHNSTLAEFENQLLANKLAINELSLAAVADKQRIYDLRVSLFFLVATVLLIAILFLWQSRKAFKHSAQTDFLTGIANRAHVFNRGQRMIDRAIKKKHPLAVIIFDIDNFKSINDQYGHQVGDLAIKAVAKRGERWLRDCDLIGRIGGEEFLIVLPDVTEADAILISERLREGIASQAFKFDDVVIELTVSIGVAALKPPQTRLTDLVNLADKGLYKAKFSGKNRVYLIEQFA
ncbi:diguanylate cyclase and serine/threonine protein kinase with TPR repeats [Shewanella pealeana ATCC 700345]|uniref:diguanylate cyclase n=1 Tax=Shewanella pealeana (strain ATCC 700345 / ANG-SQ1) TaxID=398579 RepID=A8H0B9_SHEPA|nr:diguanylate cyclase and serine/threonine protein kinase with TPR repeats [Shewanella pealeana ATCC 700345]